MIDMSWEGRDYTLFTALTMASLLLLRRAQTHGGWAWLGYTVILGLLLYTHNYAWFLVAAEGLYLVSAMVVSRRFDWRPLASLTVAVLLDVPWIPGITRADGHGDWRELLDPPPAGHHL